VRLEPFERDASCTSVMPAAETVAWVSLSPAPEQPAAALATICSRGTLVVTRGPLSDPTRFAVTAAEALNGLRAEPVTSAPRANAAPPAATQQSPEPNATPQPSSWASLALTQTLVLDANRFPLLWGSGLEGELALNSRMSFVLGLFYPISRAELSNAEVELSAGLAFLRLGIALRHSIGDFALSGSFAAGPALIWVHAQAKPPRVGGNARTTSALGSLGLQLCYPARGSVFALAGSRATLLLPAARFVLPGDRSPTLGPLLVEAAIGVGLRL